MTTLHFSSAAPGNGDSPSVPGLPKFLVGVYIGNFGSERGALSGWRELPPGSQPEGLAIDLKPSSKLIGLRPPPNSTDDDGLVYMIVMKMPDGSFSSFFTDVMYGFGNEEDAKKMIAALHGRGSTESMIFQPI